MNRFLKNPLIPFSLKAILLAGFLSPVATADLAIVVNPQNPVADLSAKQVSKVFMGRLRMFPRTELETEVLDQGANEDEFKLFYRKLVRMSPSKLKRYRASYLFTGQGNLPLQLQDGQSVKSYVAGNATAIGYIDASLVDSSVKVIYSVKTK